MILVILIFCGCFIWGFVQYCKYDDKECVGLGFCIGVLLAACMALIGGILTTTNQNEYYDYTASTIELSPIDGKCIALDGAKIYYIVDQHVRNISTGYTYIKKDETPHAIYYKYNGYNSENWFRWIFTFPDGHDYIEFYIPDGAISTTYHFEN